MHYKVFQIIRRSVEVDAKDRGAAEQCCLFRKDWDEEVEATIVQELPDTKPGRHKHGRVGATN